MADEKDKMSRESGGLKGKVMPSKPAQKRGGSPKKGGSSSSWMKPVFIILAVILGLFVLWKLMKPAISSLAHYIVRMESAIGQEGLGLSEVAVEVEKVETTTMPRLISSVGELRANAFVEIHSEISGCIKKICFKEGTEVNQGDLLIKFDDEQAQAEYRSYEAQYLLAKAEFERLEKMMKSGATSAREFDKAKGEMKMAQAKMEAAKAQIKKTEIIAPFEGRIGITDVCEGAFVQPNQKLVTLVDQTPIKVDFKVPGKFVNDIGVGQSVELKVDACKGRLFHGVIEAVDSHVDTGTNSVAVRATIPNEDGVLKAGLFVTVSVVVGEQSGIITVDESALERIGEQEFVFIIERGKARRVGVLTGAHSAGRVEVIGLSEGQDVVTAGQLRLVDGKRVKITNRPDESEAPAEAAQATPEEPAKNEPTEVLEAAPSTEAPSEAVENEAVAEADKAGIEADDAESAEQAA